MLSRTAVVWSVAAVVAIVAVAWALYWAQPDFLWPSEPAVAIGSTSDAQGPSELSARSVAPAQTGATVPPAEAAAPQAKPAAPAPSRPAFDVVNVEPTGEAVVAGHAVPNAKVELRDAGKTLAEATADRTGQFVIIPPALAPGAHSLTLATDAGEASAGVSNAITVAVPEPAPVTAKATDGQRKPAETALAPVPARVAPGSTRVAVQSIETGAGGRLVAKGVAEPNATVRLYLSGAFVGDAKTKADGRWSLTIRGGVTAGAYALRADEIDPANAAVLARAEAPFDFPAAQASAVQGAPVATSVQEKAESASPADLVVNAVQTHHVEPGHTLWGISQKFYGDGARYQLIFAANSNQIRNPNLIYPGQVFVVPRVEPRP